MNLMITEKPYIVLSGRNIVLITNNTNKINDVIYADTTKTFHELLLDEERIGIDKIIFDALYNKRDVIELITKRMKEYPRDIYINFDVNRYELYDTVEKQSTISLYNYFTYLYSELYKRGSALSIEIRDTKDSVVSSQNI